MEVGRELTWLIGCCFLNFTLAQVPPPSQSVCVQQPITETTRDPKGFGRGKSSSGVAQVQDLGYCRHGRKKGAQGVAQLARVCRFLPPRLEFLLQRSPATAKFQAIARAVVGTGEVAATSRQRKVPNDPPHDPCGGASQPRQEVSRRKVVPSDVATGDNECKFRIGANVELTSAEQQALIPHRRAPALPGRSSRSTPSTEADE